MTIAYKIHIPQTFNDGRAVPTQTIEEFLDKTLELFGGYSFNPMPIVGAWRDNDKDYVEKMFVLEVATDDLAGLTKHVEHMREVLKQECMYFVTLGKVAFV